LDKDEKLQDLVKKFYLEFYWNPLQLSLNPVNIVAQELFDSAVHQGTTTATIQLQRSLNVLNKNSKLWSDLKVDGQYGAKTHEAVIACLNEVPVSLLLTPVRALRVSRMIELIERNENLERFSAGWFARVPCWSLDQHQTS
jgi:lysozyme family protein